jgi:hypothetical protein
MGLPRRAVRRAFAAGHELACQKAPRWPLVACLNWQLDELATGAGASGSGPGPGLAVGSCERRLPMTTSG